MKKKSTLYTKKISFILMLIALSLFSFKNAVPQVPQVGQINLPSTLGGGSMPADILVANGYLFVYSGSKIEVYYENSNTFFTEISLSEKDYGKFNPVIYNKQLHGSSNMMAYNQYSNELYVVTPDLEIKRFQASFLN
ncbi:MAG: hypothetical protein L3J31_05715 [Bacteroidales bacterium]|nr:hypothetical protein [Bacteroidales bacterium]MCF6342286.1 hypothetical protein [Bacteroidales bacterium]